MTRALSSRDRYQILGGDTFELVIGAGEQLRIDTIGGDLPGAGAAVDGVKTDTLTGDADGSVSVVLTVEARYSLAWRESAAATRWCPGREVDVLALVDRDEERLRDEIAGLDKRIGNIDQAVQHGLQGADGTGLQRSRLSELIRERARLQSQLTDLIRRKRGLPAARMRA